MCQVIVAPALPTDEVVMPEIIASGIVTNASTGIIGVVTDGWVPLVDTELPIPEAIIEVVVVDCDVAGVVEFCTDIVVVAIIVAMVEIDTPPEDTVVVVLVETVGKLTISCCTVEAEEVVNVLSGVKVTFPT